MFNLRDYIMKLLKGSIGNELDYKVRENALNWQQKGVLLVEDLEEIDNLLGENITVDNTTEEIPEENEE